MKIALLTIWHVQNYGAELQAYATVRILQKLGYDVEMINIRLGDCSHPNFNGRVGHFLSSFGPGFHKFSRFWRKYIPTTRRYKNSDELKKNPPQADIYLVGSDQVWNIDITQEFAKLYFLDFGSENIKRISYASSFGTANWTHDEIRSEIINLLKRFSGVTCRESAGVNLLDREFGIKAQYVVDPTLLLGNYQEFIHNKAEKNTLVYYPLSSDSELEQSAHRVAKLLHLLPVNNRKCTFLAHLITWNQIGIEQWVENIATTKFFISRSFHGMLFAIMHKRQFAIIAGINGRSVRLQDFLEKIGLSDRYYTDFCSMEEDRPWERLIDYTIIEPIICNMRANSMNILKQMLDL